MSDPIPIEVLHALALRIDEALNRSDEEALRGFLAELESLKAVAAPGLQQAALLFNQANILAELRQAKTRREAATAWEWNSSELVSEVRCLRSAATAIRNVPMTEDRTDLRYRIWTNLGNLFSYLGRASEALDWWEMTLKEMPDYLMAMGNKGFGLSIYARSLYDQRHQTVFLMHAYDLLKATITNVDSSRPLEQHAYEGLIAEFARVARMADWELFSLNRDGHLLGDTEEERRYRIWCLEHRLFLNPLNDVEAGAIAAHDCLNVASVSVEATDDPQADQIRMPPVFGFFGQLKREFASARYLLFEAISESASAKAHYADRGLCLVETRDHRIGRTWADKAKMAYIGAYSVLDKLGPLINHHWKLGLDPQRSAEFRKVWFVAGRKGAGLNPCFESAENLSLRGLYWLSKDLYLESQDEAATDPEAAELLDLRHQIAHRYLTVHSSQTDADSAPDFLGHYRIAGGALLAKSIKMLRLVRSALLYFALAVHREEYLRGSDPTGYIGIDVPNIPDDQL